MPRLQEQTERDIYKEVLKRKPELLALAQMKLKLLNYQAYIITGCVMVGLWILIQLL